MSDTDPIDAPTGEGEPPPEMAREFGMEAVPEEGESDEDEGETIDVADAEAESEAAANGSPTEGE